MMDALLLDDHLRAWLREDLGHGDITTRAIFDGKTTALAQITAREEMVVCGMERLAARVFCLLGGPVTFGDIAPDGSRRKGGDVLLTINGPSRTLLAGERLALNLVQRLSGIATLTARFVEQVKDFKASIVDTRKTTPGLRLLEKYAVRVGGGANHRFGLSDGVLIKDNHIAGAGSVTAAVERVRSMIPHTLQIEVECDTLAQVRECLSLGVDIIMLDNMDIPTIREAVALIDSRALVEASGGVTLETVGAIAATGVDYISIGALTHSAPACDIGMDWIH